MRSAEFDARAKAHRIVVLRFADGLRVDLVPEASERDAIADVASRILASGSATLPLIEAITAAVPIERLRDLTGVKPPPPPVPARPLLSAAGMMIAVRAYSEALGNPKRSESSVSEAKERLVEFFGRYGVQLDFRVAAPPSATTNKRKAKA